MDGNSALLCVSSGILQEIWESGEGKDKIALGIADSVYSYHREAGHFHSRYMASYLLTQGGVLLTSFSLSIPFFFFLLFF